ncbi:MAG: hypothetical protein ACFE0J_00520 [Elainellaceae cyanobacterium]
MNFLFHKHVSKPLVAAVAAGSAVLVGAIALPGEAIATRSPAVHVAQSSAIQTTSAQNGTLYLNNDRIYSYNLEVEDDTRINGIYVPPGAVIQGRYEPAEGGLRYVARSVIIGDRSYNIYATSRVLEDEKDPRDISAGSIAEDAGIGALGGAILGEITGEIDAGEVIGGAAAGAATGNITADRVVVVEPDQPIYLFTQ